MATLFGRHTVTDYTAWRKVYDEADAIRKAGGVTSHAVYQTDSDPNDVTIYHEFQTIEEARAFIAQPELKAAIEKSGVVGTPEFWITQRA